MQSCQPAQNHHRATCAGCLRKLFLDLPAQFPGPTQYNRNAGAGPALGIGQELLALGFLARQACQRQIQQVDVYIAEIAVVAQLLVGQAAQNNSCSGG